MTGSKASGRRYPARHPANKCDRCRGSFNSVPRAPILQDAVRYKLAADNLCVGCCFKGAFEKRIDLTRASLRLCPVNVGDGPRAYFNLFTDATKQSRERQPHIYQRYLKAQGARDGMTSPRRSRRHKPKSRQH
jgi:hypothetical protein